MDRSTVVFRRFETFEAADDFAQTVRGQADMIRVIYSPERKDRFLPGDSDSQVLRTGSGPWIVEDAETGGMVRTWESIVAWFPAKGRLRRAMDRVRWLKAHQVVSGERGDVHIANSLGDITEEP